MHVDWLILTYSTPKSWLATNFSFWYANTPGNTWIYQPIFNPCMLIAHQYVSVRYVRSGKRPKKPELKETKPPSLVENVFCFDFPVVSLFFVSFRLLPLVSFVSVVSFRSGFSTWRIAKDAAGPERVECFLRAPLPVTLWLMSDHGTQLRWKVKKKQVCMQKTCGVW